MILISLLFFIVPLLSYKWAKKHRHKKLWTITCASVGAIIDPLVFGIYGFGFVLGSIGIPFVAIGLFLTSLSSVGFELAIFLGIQKPGIVVTGFGYLWIGLINGIIWGALFGSIGFLIDKIRIHKKLKKQ